MMVIEFTIPSNNWAAGVGERDLASSRSDTQNDDPDAHRIMQQGKDHCERLQAAG
jgi:hypothetical protein